MRVVRLVFQCGSRQGLQASTTAVVIHQLQAARDADSIIKMAEFCRSADGCQLVAGGLLADLESRPGRSVTGWLATLAGAPVGVAALVAAGEDRTARHSIAWLLVCDHARRRGVGRALVARAVDEACARGAREVWAETRADWSAAIAFWSAVGFGPVA